MPLYLYECHRCWRNEERLLPIDQRDAPQSCSACGDPMQRAVTAAVARFPGQPNSRINYADQFTADALGVPVKDVPPGLRTPRVTS